MFEFYNNLTNLGKLIFYFSVLVVLCSIFYQCYVCSFIPVQLIWRNQKKVGDSLVPTIDSPAAEIAPVVLTPSNAHRALDESVQYQISPQNIILPVPLEGFQNGSTLKNIFSSKGMGNVTKKSSSNSAARQQILRERIQASQLAKRLRDGQQKRTLSREKRRDSISDYFDRILQDAGRRKKSNKSLNDSPSSLRKSLRKVRFDPQINNQTSQTRQRQSPETRWDLKSPRSQNGAESFRFWSRSPKRNGYSRTNPAPNDRSKIILFYADWCSHCQNFKPVWNKFTKMFGKYIKTVTVNGDRNAQILSKYGVDKFPTIILDNGREKIEYDGDMTIEGLKMFVTNETKNIKSPNRETIYV